MKALVMKNRLVSSVALTVLLLIGWLAYDLSNAGKVTVTTLETYERECDFWERLFDIWPDGEDKCYVEEVKVVED